MCLVANERVAGEFEIRVPGSDLIGNVGDNATATSHHTERPVVVPRKERPLARTVGVPVHIKVLPGGIDVLRKRPRGNKVHQRWNVERVEEKLAAIWSELLGIDEVSAYDDFFDLGGHSLLATQLVSRLRDILKLDVPLRLVFEAPTVAAMAAMAESIEAAAATPDLASTGPPLVQPIQVGDGQVS